MTVKDDKIKSLCLWVFLRWPWPSHIQPATSIEAERSDNMALFGSMHLLADGTALRIATYRNFWTTNLFF